MATLNPKSINNYSSRFEELKLKESLSEPYKFSLACKELSFILRNGYSEFPKNLQSVLFQETIFALSLLSQMQMQSAISAANSLLQSAEFVLPKQKKLLAVKKYKHAVLASKRKSKADHDEGGGLISLPYDVLVHIFSFLDFQSLVSTSAICRSWNEAATDNNLWGKLYDAFFCKFGNDLKLGGLNTSRMIKDGETIYSSRGNVAPVEVQWRFAFKTAYTDICSRTFKTHRGYCSNCHSIVWVTSNACSDSPCTKFDRNHQMRPITTQQILDYIFNGSLSSETPSDSDSDDEGALIYKLWAYPRQISGCF